MKLMYFKGYCTSGTGPDGTNRAVFQNPKKLIPGKEYLVEEFKYEYERNGNGGSIYSSVKTAFRVFDVKSQELISENQWWSVFSDAPKKKCKHEDLVFLNAKSKIQQCRGCFKKFREVKKLIPV